MLDLIAYIMQYHKNVSREVRETHFFMGKYHPEYTSAYSQAYEKPRAFPALTDHSSRTTAAHFSFGNSSKTIQSETKSRYKTIDQMTSTKVSGIDRLETSKHHFDLGTEQPKFNTTANEFYKKNKNHKPESFETYLEQNRKINFTLGNQNSAKASITKTDFQPKESISNKMERDSIMHEHISTHFHVGDEKNDYRTSSKEDYKDKFFGYKPRSYSPNKLRLSLGDFKSSFLSVNTQNFTKKPLSPKTSTVKTVEAMRDSHFVLGDFGNSNKTVAQESFSSKNVTDLSSIYPETKKTSVVLGNSNPKWQTSNQSTGKNFYQVEKFDYPYKGSFVYLGFDSKKNPTTTQENYKRYSGVYTNTLDSFTSDDIKKRHFSLGASSNSYKTCNKNYGSISISPVKADGKLISELKNTHLKFGNDEALMMSTTMSEFTPKLSAKTKQFDNLKSNSIILGTHNNNWLTTKKIENARNMTF